MSNFSYSREADVPSVTNANGSAITVPTRPYAFRWIMTTVAEQSEDYCVADATRLLGTSTKTANGSLLQRHMWQTSDELVR